MDTLRLSRFNFNEESCVLSLWQKCLALLEQEFPLEFNTWIRPLQPIEERHNHTLVLLAPNQFVVEWVKQHFFARINELIESLWGDNAPTVQLAIGSHSKAIPAVSGAALSGNKPEGIVKSAVVPSQIYGQTFKPLSVGHSIKSNLIPRFSFENFVEGNSNQLALAAALQVAEHPGEAYNPLYLYGGVGLGKTHLMHAIGNLILQHHPTYQVLYLHSERFVADMVKALQTNTIDTFKQFYRSVDVLLIDDIQFFAGKDRSQEEFFHTFNSLFEGQRQVILTCDRYPKEIDALDERLKSRFGWGLTVAIEPPELETRVAILMSKAAEYQGVVLSHEVAFFIAKRIRSNVRELEGALKRVIANAHFTGKSITVEFAREALKDLLALQDKLVTIENILKTVAGYYKVKVADLLSKRRNRSVAFPRQMAMALAKELTNHSLPEIGDAFGGRDHTTVMHGCRKIKELQQLKSAVAEDYKNLLRLLTT